MIRHLVVAGFVVAFSSAGAQATDTASAKAAIMAADKALAEASTRQGPETLLAALAPGAAVLIPGQPIMKGAAEARAAFSTRYASPSSYSWNPVHAVVGNDGKFGCTMGYSRFVNALDSIRAEHRGIYLTCWRKEQDGRWRIAGTQRADTQGDSPSMADSAMLPGGPGSSRYASGSQLARAQDADSLFAMEGAEPAGPGPAFAHYAAADAMMLGGTVFPRGPQEISDAFKGYSPDRVITWRPRRDVGDGSGGLAYTVGNSISGPRAGKTGPSYYNKYMTVWRQDPDGRWLYVFDLGSERPAPK